MADDSIFPKTLYVQAGGNKTDGTGRDFFGMADLDDMNDGSGAHDGEEIAVYEFRGVKRAKVTRELVDD